jgi:hypothetical protein
VKAGKTRGLRASRDLQPSDSLHENGHYFIMESQNGKMFVGSESRLDYLSVHMHHSR